MAAAVTSFAGAVAVPVHSGRLDGLLGRQTPTFELRAPCASSAADEAIEFYESLGQRLDPWQKHVLRLGLGEDEYGDWATPEVALIVQRQNGKGGVTEAVELTALFVWGVRVITHTAHLIDTSMAAFNRVVRLVEGSDDLMRRVARINKTHGQEAIELLDGAILRFRTRTGRAGRGISGELIVFDEALELDPEQMDAMVPTILAQANPMIWYTSTVPKDSGQFLVQLRERALAGERGLAYAEWATEPEDEHGRPVNIDDPRVLANANPAYGIRVTPKTLAIVRGVLGEEGYRRECVGIWPKLGAGKVLDPAKWAKLADPASKRAGDVVVAVAITPERGWASVGVYGPRDDGLGHFRLADYRAGTDWIVPRLVELRGALNPIGFAMSRGAAASLEVELNRVGIRRPADPDRPYRGQLRVLSNQDVAAATGQLIDAVRNGAFRYVPAEQLDDAARDARTRIVGDAATWAPASPDAEITPIQVLTAGRWTYEKLADLVGEEVDMVGDVW